jgi:hypothetical protein
MTIANKAATIPYYMSRLRRRTMDEAKIYNVCLQRVKFQITNAKKRLNGFVPPEGRLVLESYNTGDIDEIIDILEIYDLDRHTREGLDEKLEDLAYTVSVLVKESVAYDYDEKGNLGLYFILNKRAGEAYDEADAELAASAR